jgi:hypothetical protein
LAATAMPFDDAVAALSRWQSGLAVERSLEIARSRAAQALAATAAPAEVTTRAAALVDGYGAGAIQYSRHRQLREPILALAGRLLAAWASADTFADSEAEVRSGYHPGSPPMRVPDAREAALPRVEPWKEEPQ